MDLGVAGRRYVLTGAVRGLGRATAEALLADGAGVVVSGRDEGRVQSAVAELRARFPSEQGVTQNIAGVAVDNADPQAPDRLWQASLDHLGGAPDGVLLSVGGPPPGPVGAITDEQWLASFESVFLGAVRLARTFGERLTDGGSITFVLSSSVRSPIPGLAISNGLRPGLAMVAKTLADELGPRGVRVNGLLPGRIETERVQQLDAAADDPAAARAAAERAIPLRRYGRAEEFGAVAAFLMSPAASFVSGAFVPVDGGMLRAL